jgi:hypothetical protein
MHRLRYDGNDRIRCATPEGEVLFEYRLARVERVETRAHRGLSLHVLAFSDWRVQEIEDLLTYVASGPRPDVILYAGDDVERFRPDGRNYFEELARLSVYGLCAVAGNDENPDSRGLIAGKRVHPVHSCPLIIGPFAVVGLEGAPLFRDGRLNMGPLLYPLAFRWSLMQRWARRFSRKKLIIVAHAPPHGVLDFAVRHARDHIGCRALREFLETSTGSVLCVCGHVHRCGGQLERIGGTVVVNVASHDRKGDAGKVAKISIKKGRIGDIQWCEIGGTQGRLFSGVSLE